MAWAPGASGASGASWEDGVPRGSGAPLAGRGGIYQPRVVGVMVRNERNVREP
jgi:hypothetical protein